MTGGTDPHVRTATVAVLTYRRPDDLAELLPLLLAEADRATVDAEVLVVDNDPDGGAADQVAAAAAGADGALRYAHEPTPGIAAARNRALDEAGGRDLLLFIDDDERPEPGWLDAMVGCWQRYGSTVVAGPVISRFPSEPGPWIRSGRFFDRRRPPTGTDLELVATNNLLIDLHGLAALGDLRFDVRYGLSGGSDTLFSRHLVQRGGSMIWCDEAVVHDVVPPGRMTRQWVLRRAYRMGNTWMRTSLEASPPGTGRALVWSRLVVAGLVRLGGGGLRVAWGGVTGRMSHRARGMRTAARGAGLLAGGLGVVYAEYRRA